MLKGNISKRKKKYLNGAFAMYFNHSSADNVSSNLSNFYSE